MKPTVAVLGTLRFPPERMDMLMPHLLAVVEATNRLDGCIHYQFALDPVQPGVLHLSELWPDHETLARHLQAPHMNPWRAAVKDCGMIERQLAVYDITLNRKL